MKKLIVLFLFLFSIGFSQTRNNPDDDESGGLTFVYPHNGDIFQSGNVQQGEADIAWKFIVQLTRIDNWGIKINKLNESGQYIQVSSQSGYYGTIRATGVGNYQIVGWATGINMNGQLVTYSHPVSPLYVQDSQAPSIPNSLQIVHSANHPKLTWDIWPIGLDYQGFKIYKKITEELGWQYLSSTVTTIHEYVDATETYPIPGGIGTTHPVSYYVTAYDINGNESVPSDFVTTNVSGALVDKIRLNGLNTQTKVENYALGQNYPNPFNPSTAIQYEVKEPGLVKLEVYNILGNKVREPVNEVKGTGIYNIIFDAANLPSGIYIYKININNYSAIQKMSLLK